MNIQSFSDMYIVTTTKKKETKERSESQIYRDEVEVKLSSLTSPDQSVMRTKYVSPVQIQRKLLQRATRTRDTLFCKILSEGQNVIKKRIIRSINVPIMTHHAGLVVLVIIITIIGITAKKSIVSKESHADFRRAAIRRAVRRVRRA